MTPWIDRDEDIYHADAEAKNYPTVSDEENSEADQWTSVVDANNENDFLLKVMRAAKKRKDTDPESYLIDRLPGSSPNTMQTDGEYAKLLHHARLQTVRRYLKEYKQTAAIAHERAYRNLDDLDLTLPEGIEEWKQDILEGYRNELTKQPYWTTGQKERFLLETKRRFVEDYGEDSGHSTWKWLVDDTNAERAAFEAQQERENRRASGKRTTKRRKVKAKRK